MVERLVYGCAHYSRIRPPPNRALAISYFSTAASDILSIRMLLTLVSSRPFALFRHQDLTGGQDTAAMQLRNCLTTSYLSSSVSRKARPHCCPEKFFLPKVFVMAGRVLKDTGYGCMSSTESLGLDAYLPAAPPSSDIETA